ncbi:unnamed protein product [Rhizophagus irregularis]|nr:unnamed protein product [Rhizophagus irregularis]
MACSCLNNTSELINIARLSLQLPLKCCQTCGSEYPICFCQEMCTLKPSTRKYVYFVCSKKECNYIDDIQEDIDKEIKKIEKENREFATEEEIQEESQCLENVKEMGVQAAIKHIKEENKNVDNLKAYICHELSLQSPRHNGNVISKKRSAPLSNFSLYKSLWKSSFL